MLTFKDPADLLLYATQNWRSHLVLTDPLPLLDLDEFSKRPSFLLVRVDAGLMVRYRRSERTFQNVLWSDLRLTLRAPLTPSRRSTLVQRPEGAADDLAQFALQSDESLYGVRPPTSAPLANGVAPNTPGPSPINDLTSYVGLSVVNNYDTLEALHVHLDRIKLDDPERLRPGWDRYFMVRLSPFCTRTIPPTDDSLSLPSQTLASLASLRSNCMKRRVGALLVKSNRIVSTGYNGTPRGMQNCNEGGCARCNSGTVGGGGRESF